MSAYSLRTRGFIRGSIPLSSTIKRLVRRGSGKANGQKPKMYGHADRIARQDRGSGKLPTLLDCCVLTAYSCPMTISDNAQREELQAVIYGYFGPPSQIKPYKKSPVEQDCELAETILAAGYRKPRTITTVEELDALPIEAVVRSDMYNVYIKDHDLDNPTDTWWVAVGGVSEYQSNRILLPATVLHELDAEVGA